jgi:hypothetical protein
MRLKPICANIKASGFASGDLRKAVCYFTLALGGCQGLISFRFLVADDGLIEIRT